VIDLPRFGGVFLCAVMETRSPSSRVPAAEKFLKWRGQCAGHVPRRQSSATLRVRCVPSAV